MNSSKTFFTLIAAGALAAAGGAFAEDKKETAPAAVPSPAAPVAADDVVCKGKDLEIKRSQLEEAFIVFKANLAARGQSIPESDRAMVEERLLDRLIFTQLLLAKAGDADKAKGKEMSEKVISDFRRQAPSEELFNQQIKAMGLTIEQFRTQVREQAICEQVLDRELRTKQTVTDEQARKFFEDNAVKFDAPEQVRAAHVLLSTRDQASGGELTDEQKKEKKAVAEKVLTRAKAGEDFGKLAKEFSEDPGSKDNGGEYTFPRGQMVPEFEAAAFSMNTNQVSDIVTTQFGFHIIKLYEKLPAKKGDYAKVEKEIKDRLAMEEVQKQLPEYLEKMKKEASVEIGGAKEKK